ncbi:MAG TPA: sortase [Thermoleophilaceae bacterium]|nr:sortase [Thermoleophilaceae bacterium]
MIRAVLHFVSAVLMVSGVLLIVDAGLTVAWQEPISSFLAHREQQELEREIADPPRRVLERRPLPGDALGQIRIPAIDSSEFIVEGTDQDNLRKGPGHYPSTALPGDRGTVAIAGHRTTYGAPFRDLDKLDPGDRIEVDMPYRTFVYRVERTQIVDPSALWVTRRVGYDRLVLSACHPLYSAAERIIVFARLVGRRPARVGRGAQARTAGARASSSIREASRDSR